MKVNDENSRIRIQDPDPDPNPDPNPDPLVRVMDPRIRIRIHPKMSWIRNTGGRTWMPCSAAGRGLEVTLASVVFHLASLGRNWCRNLLRPASSFLGGLVSRLFLANQHARSELAKAASLASSADLSSLDWFSLLASFSSCFHSFRISGSS